MTKHTTAVSIRRAKGALFDRIGSQILPNRMPLAMSNQPAAAQPTRISSLEKRLVGRKLRLAGRYVHVFFLSPKSVPVFLCVIGKANDALPAYYPSMTKHNSCSSSTKPTTLASSMHLSASIHCNACRSSSMESL